MKKILSLVLTLALAASANATLIEESFTGTFDDDNSRYYIDFEVTVDSTIVDLTSWGYAGGVNADGVTIADGGFDSQLFIFDATDLLVDDDDGSDEISLSSGLSYDAFLSVELDIGFYTAVLTQFDSDYLSGDLFSGSWSDADTLNFVDAGDNQRTSSFAFDISGQDLENVGGSGVGTTPPASPIPEPTTIALFGLALAGFAARRKNN